MRWSRQFNMGYRRKRNEMWRLWWRSQDNAQATDQCSRDEVKELERRLNVESDLNVEYLWCIDINFEYASRLSKIGWLRLITHVMYLYGFYFLIKCYFDKGVSSTHSFGYCVELSFESIGPTHSFCFSIWIVLQMCRFYTYILLSCLSCLSKMWVLCS